MVAEIDSFPNQGVADADAEQLATQFMEKYQVACPVLSDDISIDKPDFSSGPRVNVAVTVPFTGCADLFRYSGGRSPIITENVQVRADHLVILLEMGRGSASQFEQKVDQLIARIRDDGLRHIEAGVSNGNLFLRTQAVQRIRERQRDFARHQQTIGELQQTKFRVRRREDEAASAVVPVKPKVITIPPKPLPAEPEPELSLADYDEILSVIRSMANVYQRSPSVFAEMEEEDLRTILLVGLNGVFKGDATGETFNGEGKSDILIRVADRNVFIAECLFWDGQEKFRKKLADQLFRYTTWHDSKLAAIVFNRKKDFSETVRKMKEVAAALPNRVAEMPYDVPTGCRHRMRREDDAQKHFILTCLAFEVPS
jgi:hypothetical protein